MWVWGHGGWALLALTPPLGCVPRDQGPWTHGRQALRVPHSLTRLPLRIRATLFPGTVRSVIFREKTAQVNEGSSDIFLSIYSCKWYVTHYCDLWYFSNTNQKMWFFYWNQKQWILGSNCHLMLIFITNTRSFRLQKNKGFELAAKAKPSSSV